MKFRALLMQTGKTAAGMEVPPEIVEGLGGGKHPAVKVTINGYTYRSSIAVMGGVFMLGVSAANREGAGVEAGQTLDVEVALDTEPRKIEAPEDFAAALAADPEAKKFFEGMSYSNQRRHVDPINDAKTPETRQRRIEKSVRTLHDGKI